MTTQGLLLTAFRSLEDERRSRTPISVIPAAETWSEEDSELLLLLDRVAEQPSATQEA